MARQGRKAAQVIDRDEQRRERSSTDDYRGATIERIRQSGGHFSVGDDKQGGKTWTMMDSPLERLRAQERITKHEYDGLAKFRIHWHHGGLQPSLSSVDPNRIFAADPSNFSGMAKSERQVFHRQQYREAIEMLGHRARIVLENVVCTEQAVVTAGYALGWKNRPQAEAAAIESLRDSGWRLAKHWGMC